MIKYDFKEYLVLSDQREGIIGNTSLSPTSLLILAVWVKTERQLSFDPYVKAVKERSIARSTSSKRFLEFKQSFMELLDLKMTDTP